MDDELAGCATIIVVPLLLSIGAFAAGFCGTLGAVFALRWLDVIQ